MPNQPEVSPNEQMVQEVQQKPEAPQNMKPDQEQMDMFIINGMKIVHDEKASDGFLDRISKSGEPIKAIAEITVDIVFRLSDAAEQEGQKLSTGTLVHGSNFLMGEIINITETAGMQKLTDEQKTQSYQLAVSMYLDRAVKTGKMTKAELAQLGQEASQTPEGQKITQAGKEMNPQMQQGQPMQQEQAQPAQPGILAGGM